MKAHKFNSFIILTIIAFSVMVSCKKFIEVEPPATSVNEDNVYKYDGSSIASVLGIYSTIAGNNFAGQLAFYPELAADNMFILNLTSAPQIPYYQNNLRANDLNSVPKPWSVIYPQIYNCNAAIEGLNGSTTINPSVKKHLLGQAYFLRAFFYFYLTNFYGDVPLAVSTDYNVNRQMSRTPAVIVHQQIVEDLKQAQSLLPNDYLSADMKSSFPLGSDERVTANRYAALALLAREYLYLKDWNNAEITATEVINASNLYSVQIPLNDVFLKNSKETILALQPVGNNANSAEADFYVLRPSEPAATKSRSGYLTDEFMAEFEIGDQRKYAWIGIQTNVDIPYPYPAKYKVFSPNPVKTEYSILLRFAELYLIRAEARIQLNKVSDGIADLNVLRDRATDKNELDESKRLVKLPTSLLKDQALEAVYHERRIELFAEGAHRWFDLKRTGQIDAVMALASPKKGGTWSSYKAFFPIPANEITNNGNLSQNTGYTN